MLSAWWGSALISTARIGKAPIGRVPRLFDLWPSYFEGPGFRVSKGGGCAPGGTSGDYLSHLQHEVPGGEDRKRDIDKDFIIVEQAVALIQNILDEACLLMPRGHSRPVNAMLCSIAEFCRMAWAGGLKPLLPPAPYDPIC